jgi:adenosylhomocysteine nucleosidase
MAAILVAAPQVDEAQPLIDAFRHRAHRSRALQVGVMECFAIPALDMVVAIGGHGKAQFAVQAQYLIDRSPEARVFLCVGAAGSLTDSLKLGDVVVGTHSVEHDYKLRFVRQPSPCHDADATLLQEFRETVRTHTFRFRVHFGPIASGDEDIVDPVRAQELRAATEALCVAWEGSGGARAACFNGLRFLEVRCITDGADSDAAVSFHEHLVQVMPNVAELIICWQSLRRKAAEPAPAADAPQAARL